VSGLDVEKQVSAPRKILMMEQSPITSRIPFSGEAGNQVRPLSSSEPKGGLHSRSSPEIEPIENMSLSGTMDAQMVNAPPGPQHQQSVSLGNSAVQQPKVQTAFIHKLYKYCPSPESLPYPCSES